MFSKLSIPSKSFYWENKKKKRKIFESADKITIAGILVRTELHVPLLRVLTYTYLIPGIKLFLGIKRQRNVGTYVKLYVVKLYAN